MTQKTGGRRRLIRLLLMVSLATLFLIPVRAQDETGLDRYVNKPDASFEWQVVKSYPGLGYASLSIRMTSQKWLDRTKVEPNFWRHWLRVIIPSHVRRTTAVLLVDGGTRDEPDPGPAELELGLAAVATGTIIAELQAVPNQPLTTTDDAQPRSEDNLLAYSWNKFLFTGEEDWVAQSAMTKSVVRAMDAISELCAEPEPCNGAITKFVVGGGSKRGWASWLAAAADFDKRVVAIVPTVIDVLNVQQNLVHHYQAYGDWSPAIADYIEFGIPAWIGSKQMQELLTIVDPYTYLSRLTMPKYIINSTGDQFFPPDSSQFYFDDLQGENYLRYVPNTDHSLEGAGDDSLAGALAWADALLNGAQLPRFTSKFEDDGRIVVTAQDAPAEVKLWQATNPAARDFRLATIGKAWTATTVESSGEGVYEGVVPAPAAGWRAYFLELTYTNGFAVPLKFTTAVRIIPDTLPFGPPPVSVHAASYDPLSSPHSIASVFGAGFTDRVEFASEIPLPTELAGIRLRLIDANNVPYWAELFYAGPQQINYLVPEVIAQGLTRIEVVRNGQVLVRGQSNIVDVAPGLFSANSNGSGVAAGERLRVTIEGQRDVQPLFALNSEGTAYEEVPFALGVNTNQTFLILFGTGMRRAKTIRATIDGVEVEATNPIPSTEFIGLDQVNLGPLPTTLANRGVVEIVLEIDGKKTNPVTIRIL